MRQQRGFTMIELVVTLTIIGVLAVVAFGRLDFVSTFDEKAYHDKLTASLQFARKAAVAKRRYVCVSVVGNTVSFTIDSNVPESTATPFGGTCPFGAAMPLPAADKSCGGAANQICAPSGVTLTASKNSFQFDAQGRASDGDGATSTVTFSMTGQPGITVVEETGYVH